MADVMLTTIDNPYNPFTQADEWLRFDIEHGYNTNAYLNRMIEQENFEDPTVEQIATVIDKIVLHDPANFYKKIIKKN